MTAREIYRVEIGVSPGLPADVFLVVAASAEQTLKKIKDRINMKDYAEGTTVQSVVALSGRVLE